MCQQPIGKRVIALTSYTVTDGRLNFTNTGSVVEVIPQELCQLPLLRGFNDTGVLSALASRFVQQEFAPGEIIVQLGQRADRLFSIAHGKVNKVVVGKYGDEPLLDMLADGDHFGDETVVESESTWKFTIKAVTRCTVLALPQQAFRELLNQSGALQAQVEQLVTS